VVLFSKLSKTDTETTLEEKNENLNSILRNGIHHVFYTATVKYNTGRSGHSTA
jgi:hypothetical protein